MPRVTMNFGVQGVTCDPISNLCRLVTYTATNLDFEAANLTCTPESSAFHAVLIGELSGMLELVTLVEAGFPGVATSLEHPHIGPPANADGKRASLRT